MSAVRTITPEELDRLVQYVVEKTHPLRITLFGSAARDELHDESDIDLLVVVPDGSDPLQVELALYGGRAYHPLWINRPVQFVVTTPALLARHSNDHRKLAYHVARDGRELYAA